ncbi:CvpA family protein [Glycocaulis sp.]|uniref:CvpA family protein n=1 Tax=Glycocaulis sp. TaxID=1969725 RepID=UPI003F6F9189
MEAGLAGFDLFALLVLFVSGILALMRGFVREALTIAAFVAAALAALWSRPVFAGLLEGLLGSPLIANIIALAGVFILVYLAVSFVTSSLQPNAKAGEDVNVIDRSLGFVFGLVRGLVLLGLFVLVFKNTLPGAQPEWLQGARIYPLANATATLLQRLAPEGSWAEGPRESEVPDAPPTDEDLDRDAMDRLMRSVSPE